MICTNWRNVLLSLRRRRVTSNFYPALRKTQKARDVPARDNSLPRKAGKSKGHLRRHLIVRALHDLMLAKGYAETSLSDLAEAVGMSVSHLLYYFDSKEAVLEELCGKINTRVLTNITPPSDDSPEQRIMALVDHVFTGRGRPRQEYRLTAEMAALSVNRPKIRQLITEFNEQWSASLTIWFQQIPRPSGISAEDASVRTRAVLAGLVNNAQFDAHLGVRRLHRLFRLALLDMLGVRTLRLHPGSQHPGESHIGKNASHEITCCSQAD
jgi:AcrR family transcriptional regulator